LELIALFSIRETAYKINKYMIMSVMSTYCVQSLGVRLKWRKVWQNIAITSLTSATAPSIA